MSESRREKINNPDAKKLKVLVAPLDWGLGHVTRCIPIIKELLHQDCTVIVAASDAQKTLLLEEFPGVSIVKTPGFRIKYGKNRAFTLARIIFQIPKILIGIKRENQWLRGFVGREGLDLVISDNRFGLYNRGLLSVFMTHQLAIRSSMGPVLDRFLQKMNYAFIRRFSVCWVPDLPGGINLAGNLAHPPDLPRVEVRYIGWLSRLEPATSAFGSEPAIEAFPPCADQGSAPSTFLRSDEQGFDLLILLSGPEPQRTMFEKIVLAQLAGIAGEMGRIVLVRGLPNGDGSFRAPAGISVHDYLNAQDLAHAISQSKLVLARSGYSTVMDLVRMGKTAIYVPTPGQPEQEYLGKYLQQKGWGISVCQTGFSLLEAISKASGLHIKNTNPPEGNDTLLKGKQTDIFLKAKQNDILPKEIQRILAMARSNHS